MSKNIATLVGSDQEIFLASMLAAMASNPSSSRAALAAASFSESVPSNATGADGDFHVVAPSGIIYKKISGVWTAYAASPSRLTHAVTATPAAGYGANGDLALLYTGGAVTALLEKQSGTWVSLAAFGAGSVVTIVTSTPTGGNDGDMALFSTAGIITALWKKTSGTWAQSALFRQTSDDFGTIHISDDFVGGVAGTSGQIGSLGWILTGSTAGQACRLAADESNTTTFGVAQLVAPSGVDAAARLHFADNSGTGLPFLSTAAAKKVGMSMKFRFKVQTTEEYYLGFSTQPTGAAQTPPRFVGVQVIPGEANFRFRSMEGGGGTNVDSGVPVDALYHNFEMTWNGTNWRMCLDGGSWMDVTPTTSGTLTIAMWCRQKTSSASLWIDFFSFTAPRY
jgi:hypothetical protein